MQVREDAQREKKDVVTLLLLLLYIKIINYLVLIPSSSISSPYCVFVEPRSRGLMVNDSKFPSAAESSLLSDGGPTIWIEGRLERPPPLPAADILD